MALNHDSTGNIERQQPAGGLSETNGHGPHARDRRPSSRPARRRRAPLWRSLALPALIGLTCGGGAYFVAKHFVTPTYSAATTLWFPSAGGSSMGNLLGALGGGAPGEGNIALLGQIYSAPQYGISPSTAMSVLASGQCQAQVVNKLNLPARWHLRPDAAYARLIKSVSYGVNRDGFLAVQASDPNPRLAVQIVNTYVQSMREVTRQMNAGRTQEVRKQLERTYVNSRVQLDRQNVQLAALMAGNIRRMPLGTGATTTYQGLVGEKISTQEELKATTTQLERQIRTARRTYVAGTNLPTSVPFAGDTLARLRKAESDFRVARNLFGEDNPDYQKAELALKQARAETEAESKRQIAAVNTGLTPNISDLAIKQATLQGRLDYIDRTMAPIKTIMLSMPAAKIREDQLAADINTNRALVNTLAVALQQARLAEGSQSVSPFRVIDPAGVPTVPISPRPLFMMIFAAITGFLLAAAFQVARAVLRQPALTDEMRRWSEKYIVMDPYDEDQPALEEEPRRSLTGDAGRRALPNDAAPALDTTDRTRVPEVEHEHTT